MTTLDGQLILVTGAAGWLGADVVHALAEGIRDCPALATPPREARIRCLVPEGNDTTLLTALSPHIEIMTGDLRDPGACEAFCRNAHGATLLHLAGIIHPRKVSEFYAVNLAGTQHVLDAAVDAGVRRAVVMSSNSPCGCNPFPDHLFDEDSPYHPYMNYGRSKMMMERVVRQFQEHDEIETVLIRAPWFYGPYQPARQTLFFKMVRDGKAPIVGNGHNLRSMSYIDNLAQGVLLAAIHDKAVGEIFWIADEHPYTMNQIVDTIEILLENEFSQKCAHKRMRLPGIASEIALMMDWSLQKLGLYHQKIHVLSEMNKTIACSVAKAGRVLGYQPTVALEEGMRRSLRWVFEHQGGLDR